LLTIDLLCFAVGAFASCTRGTGGGPAFLTVGSATIGWSLPLSFGLLTGCFLAMGFVDAEQSHVSPSLASLQSHCESL